MTMNAEHKSKFADLRIHRQWGRHILQWDETPKQTNQQNKQTNKLFCE